ncbi:MAG TPA: response regulator [Bryobacteraceae bacterium]|nr:response regulator [Bryobacteraceae bacterium]
MPSAPSRILVVDDDAALLKVMSAYLSRLGYQVDACQSAEDGWEKMRTDPSAYSLALVDLQMPGIGGHEFAAHLLQCNPALRVVLASGYTAEISGLETLDGERVSFLHKPFSPDQLIQAIR